jgi:hypothetical protein
MRSTTHRPRRRGAVTTEAALVLPVFLTIVVGMVDLGVGVFRFNTLSNASRHGARQAIVHGERAPAGWNGGRWRPGTGSSPNAIDEVSTASVPAVDAIRPMLVNCPPNQTRVRYEWLGGTDAIGASVRCTVTSEYQPLLTVVFGGSVISLTASSTMPIAH